MALRARRDRRREGEERRGPAMVLVVGDDPDATELICRVLEDDDYLTARTSEAGEATALAMQVLPRCIVIDMAASGVGSSLKVLETIRQHRDSRVNDARVVLVALSASNRLYSIQSGVDAFLTRPFHVDELLATVAETIDRPPEERRAHRARMLEAARTEDPRRS